MQEYRREDKERIKEFVSEILEELFNSPARGLEDLEDIDKNFTKFWVEKHDGKIIGTIGLKKEGGKFRITRMYVHKTLRGKKIGTKLINRLLKYCKENKITNLFLTTYKQMNSIGFYEKIGFKIKRKERYVIWMEYIL